jgi:Bax protein
MTDMQQKLIKLTALGVLMIGLGTSEPFAKEEEVVVEVYSAADVAAYYEEIGFLDIDAHPERLQAVPCTRLARVPETLQDVWKENVSLRKSVFFRLAVSAALQVNETILTERERLLGLSVDNLSAVDRAWLLEMVVRYGVAEAGASHTAEDMDELKIRVDVLPPSLVILQGAIESGWLQSRFAHQGQALFGQWTTSETGIKAQGSDARLAAFNNPREALIAYMLNINTHRVYRGLREARADMRRKGELVDGHVLAGYLESYAEIGEEYVRLIRSMMRRDGLGRADTAKLADGPCILFQQVD